MADPVKVSLSQLLTFDRCSYQWWLKYQNKFERAKKGYRLELGNMGHELLFDWYNTGQDNSQAYAERWLRDWDNLDAEQVQNVAIAVSMFKMYREEFSPMEDRGLITTGLEEHFEIELLTPKGRKFVLEGYIDRISMDNNGNLWLEDYKWTGKFWSPIEILMDPQLSFYGAAKRLMGVPIHGLMITQINTYPYKDRQKKKLEDLIKRERFYRGPEEFDKVLYEIGRMVDDLIEQRDSPRRSLRKDCKMCDFQEPCLMGLKGIDPILFLSGSTGYKRREPRPEGADKKVGPTPLDTGRPRTRITSVKVEGDIIDLST